MKCPDCDTELIRGELHKEKDGTEYFEMKCPRCRKKFIDLKIPHSALNNYEEET